MVSVSLFGALGEGSLLSRKNSVCFYCTGDAQFRISWLSILDSFVCGVLMGTVNSRGNGPEIAYLCDGVNGIVTQMRWDPTAPVLWSC